MNQGINPLYVTTTSLEEYFVDKDTGLPLAGGLIYFYRDSQRNIPKTVYTITGSPPNYSYTALPNPMILSSVGTPQDASGNNVPIYYYPWIDNPDGSQTLDLYYIQVFSSGGAPQEVRQGWPNQEAQSVSPIIDDQIEVDNQISNPQFTQVFLNVPTASPTIYAFSAASSVQVNIAPDWFLTVSGSGTVSVSRTALDAVPPTITNPPYILNIIVSIGITDCTLTQRLYTNSGLWQSTPTQPIFLSTTVVAEVNSGSSSNALSMFYGASSGTFIGADSIQILLAALTSELVQYTGGAIIPPTGDTDSGTNGYVDIFFKFTAGQNISLTSVQVIPVISEDTAITVNYAQLSSNRAQAYMGDYYIPRLNFKPVPSLLVGWDFPLNPAQFAVGTVTMPLNAGVKYLWDQTIGASAAVTNTVIADPITDGFQITTNASVPAGGDACYIMQYLSGSQAKKLLGTRLSVNINAYTTTNDQIVAGVYLFRAPSTSSVPNITTNNSIGTVNATGTFSLSAAGWTQIPRNNLATTTPAASAQLQYVVNNNQINSGNDFGFSGWEITDSTQIADTEYFAIVITFSYKQSNTVITVDSISLVPGDIPTRPAPQSTDEVLRECQYYYQQTYPSGIGVGAITNVGAISANQTTTQTNTNMGFYAIPFEVYYSAKRVNNPVLTFYSPSTLNASGNVRGQLWRQTSLSVESDLVITNWTQSAISPNVAYYIPAMGGLLMSGVASQLGSSANIFFHYTSDARLGVV